MENAWETHKDIMRRLFLTEKMSLRDVMDYMKNTYNFQASKAQYERQFKKWKLREHLKSSDWRAIRRRIENRRRRGKKSDLYVDSILIKGDKIRKETSRHDWPTVQERYGQGTLHNPLVHDLRYSPSQHRAQRHRKRFTSARLQPCQRTIICWKIFRGSSSKAILILKVLMPRILAA
ncbi:uncharacterized protein Z518_07730 [Rhinocladiella mackenziei CBS 650.93]|uniref:Clr5 domain-containing protein n=1 Tax=Rhinocladiella mackenziei CBS 650.93 TaxID=1442369 RepID=A0A0D2ILW1_9EURO|nr:uncharacterized protein Z518_07730 [Rhinocladiella mackenziei CBS 650.93]KIX04176.1 hypothetical protein Z518_07730 [Rhinocladiella mackenziei CBS 650.93]